MRILSAVVLFTVAMALVCVRSDQITAQRSVHDTSGDGQVAGDHGLMIMSNATNMVRAQDRVWNATSKLIQEPAGKQSHVTTLSRNDGVVFQDKQLKTRKLISKNRTQIFVIGGNLFKKRPHSTYHRNANISTIFDENLNNESETSQDLHKIDIRLNPRQINNYGYPTIQIDKTVEHKDISNNNQNAYDLTYDINENLEENKNSIDRSGWRRFFNRSGQIIPGGLWLLEIPEISSSSDQLPFRLGTHYQNKKDMEYMFKQYNVNRNPKITERQLLKHIPPIYTIDLKTHPILNTKQDSSILQHHEGIVTKQNNISSSSQPITYEVLWRRIGLMALIKLGLVKLKVIGFIKFLYLLLFKLKFILIVLFLKFFSILKFIKFSSLPLFLLPIAAIIFLMTMITFPAYSSLMLDMNNPSIISTPNTPIPNNEKVINAPDGTIQFTEEIISTPGETILVPSSQTQTIVVPSGQTQVIPGLNIPSDVIQGSNNIGLRYEPFEVMDPTLDLFQKELNSEKCVERIACKIAANGKTGIIPLWINWALHRVSKPVPDDKLLYYLKAYDNVINEIHMESPNPDNWETWCFERYNCNNTDT